MGTCFGSPEKIQPQELNYRQHFGRGDSDDSEDGSTRNTKHRTCTDVCFLMFMAAFMITLAGLLIYCMSHGDINRVINGYDDCGNVCGLTNKKVTNISCSGKDMHELKYLLLSSSKSSQMVDDLPMNKKCVKSCEEYSGYKTFINRCVPKPGEETVNTFFSKTGLKNFFAEASEDLHLCWQEVIYMCLIALGFSIVIILLMRFFAGIVVWVVLIGVSIACLIGTIMLWILYESAKKNVDNSGSHSSLIDNNRKNTYLIFAIIATVITSLVLIVIIAMRKRILLVVQLFKEAGKAIASMPLLLLEPLLTFVALVMSISLWIYFTVWIQSSGELMATNGAYKYKADTVMYVTRWYNLLAMFWMVQFIIGCQHMIIAGSVSTWYFVREKSNLSSPISNSFGNLVRFHLGSVALGSFIIALVQFIRFVLSTIQSQLKNRTGRCVECTLKCCQCCLMCFEKILKYLTRNAYIEVAMYGRSFCNGGQQAFKLLTSNALRVTMINSVGDFVLFLGKVLVVMATVLLGIEILKHKEGLHHIWVPVGIAGLFAYFISHCFMTVYEMSIDTIFLCFCEDCEQNDGVSRPYYMSRGLMDFVENSKKVLAYYDKSREHGQAWQPGPATISDKVEQ